MFQSFSVNKVKPLAGYVLVEPAAMDDGAKIECPVKNKDQVIYKKWGGNEFKIGEVEYQFLKFEDLLAVVK
jgi:chaperonin GroES